MLCDIFDAEMASSVELESFHTRVLVRLDGGLVLEQRTASNSAEFLELKPSSFSITYKPRSDQPRYCGKPFMLTLPNEVYARRRYKDWDDFCEESKTSPVINWLKQWSNINKKLFAVLERNRGLAFTIGIDYVGYEKHLRELYIERFGEKPKHSLLCEPYEAEAGAAAHEEYKKRIYKESIRRKIEQGKNPERRNNK